MKPARITSHLIVTLAIVGMLTGAWAPHAHAQRTLRVALASETATLGPTFLHGFPDMTRYLLMFDPLIDLGPDMNFRGRLAVSWRQTAPTVWEFTLRPDVKFHNGERFTARDVKANIDWVLDPSKRSPLRAYWINIERTEVVDDGTLRIHTKVVLPTLPNVFIDRGMFPGEYLTKVGADAFGRKPIGTGPFKFLEWIPGQRLVVEANREYWDGRPSLDRVEVFPVPEPATRVAALFAGDVDVIEKPPMENLARLKAAADVKVITYPTAALLTFMMNTKTKPLADVRVRRAIHHAVDVDKIITTILGGIGERQLGQLPVGVPGRNPSLKPYEYSPEKARQLLAAAGYAGGFPLKIHTASGRYFQDLQISEAVGGYLAAVGIKAEVTPIEWGTHLRALQGNPLVDGLLMVGMARYDLDPANMYRQYVWKDLGRAAYYSRPDLEQLGKQALSEPDSGKRARLYQVMEEEVWSDAFWLPITRRSEILVMKRHVEFAPRATEYLYLREARLAR